MNEKKFAESMIKATDKVKAIIGEQQAADVINTVLKEFGLMCRENGCTLPSRAKGMCTKHYQTSHRKVVTPTSAPTPAVPPTVQQ